MDYKEYKAMIEDEDNSLEHYGVLGMHWGIRKKERKKETTFTAYKESKLRIQENKDGSKVVPAGFMFNRIGQAGFDINESGALYVSSGKDDAARYVKNLGPSLLGRLLKTSGTTIHHISVKQDLKIPSDKTITKVIADTLTKDPKLLKAFNNSLYSMVLNPDWDNNFSKEDISGYAEKSPALLAYSVNSFFADPEQVKETKKFYSEFQKLGFDALPDTHDILSGTSKTAMIILNPNKVEIKSSTALTKDVYKTGKEYVKTLEDLKVDDIILN